MNFGHQDEKIAFRKSLSDMGEAAKTICGMLNRQGYGTILFGVAPSGEPKGIVVTDAVMRDLSRKIYERINPKIIPTVNKRAAIDKDILEVSFRGEERPYSTKGDYYYREGTTDRVLSKEELGSILGFGSDDSWDGRLSPLAADQINEDLIDRFSNEDDEIKRLNPNEYLIESGLSRNGKLTNAGRLMFGNDKPLTISIAVYATNEPTTYLDYKQENGNILELMEAAYGYIAKNIRWVEEYKNEERREVPEIPLDAIKEILINAFDHADYEEASNPRISIHPGFISIFSPGDFPAGYKPEDFIEGGNTGLKRNPSINKILASMTDRPNPCGFAYVFEACKRNKIAISYSMGKGGFTFVFRRKSLNSVAGSTSRKPLGKDEDELLTLLKKQPKISIGSISKLLDKSPRTIQRMLTSLKAKGYIKRIGNTRGYWKVNK